MKDLTFARWNPARYLQMLAVFHQSFIYNCLLQPLSTSACSILMHVWSENYDKTPTSIKYLFFVCKTPGEVSTVVSTFGNSVLQLDTKM